MIQPYPDGEFQGLYPAIVIQPWPDQAETIREF
jgi:hypothetical protein